MRQISLVLSVFAAALIATVTIPASVNMAEASEVIYNDFLKKDVSDNQETQGSAVIRFEIGVSGPSAGWQKQSDGSWKYSLNGSYAKNGWQEIDGHYYLFDGEGTMLKGWQEVNGQMFYLSEASTAGHPEGSCYVDEIAPDGSRVGTDGARITDVIFPQVAVHPNPYGDYSFVEVDLTNQCVFLFQGTKLLLYSPCVTGWTYAGRETPEGSYHIYLKDTNRTLRGYNSDGSLSYASFVNYWMPFNGGIGLHDATWRRNFGGSIYKSDGSHGCINLPLAIAAQMYDIVYVGYPVIVHS